MPIKGFILIVLLVFVIAFRYRSSIYEWLCEETEGNAEEYHEDNEECLEENT